MSEKKATTKKAPPAPPVPAVPPAPVKSLLEKKVELWCHCLDKGWLLLSQPVGMNCLYRQNLKGEKMRLRFTETELVMERKRPLTEEERKTQPNQTTLWELAGKAVYDKVEVKPNGLFFRK